MKLLTRSLLICLPFFALACGMEHKATGGTDNTVSGDVTTRIEMAFPTCEGIQDESLLVECVKAATKFIIEIKGLDGLDNDQLIVLQDILNILEEEK